MLVVVRKQTSGKKKLNMSVPSAPFMFQASASKNFHDGYQEFEESSDKKGYKPNKRLYQAGPDTFVGRHDKF